MTDKSKDVFADAAALVLKRFPPRVITITQDRAELERLYPKGGDGKSTQPVIPEDIDAQMRPYRDLGRAALPPALATAIDKLKVRDKLLQALGAIERAASEDQAEDIKSRADTYAISAMEFDRDLSHSDWRALDSHIRERVAAKRSK